MRAIAITRPSRQILAVTATLILATTMIVASPKIAQSASKARIYAAYYDPNTSGPDPDTNAGRNSEYIVIRNYSTVRVRMRGWVLHDVPRLGTVNRFVFPTFTLRPGKVVRIHTGTGANTRTDLYWGKTTYVWGDDSDTATLQNRAGTIMSTCGWTSTSTSPKYC